MSEPSPLSERERADLVAYLDGELTGEAARALEGKLSRHPEVRAEAEALRRTWAMLDFLPRAKPSTDFTHRTMEKLTPIRNARLLRWQTGWLGLAWILAMVLAGWGGYAAYNRFAPMEPIEKMTVQQPNKDLQERQWIEKLPRKVREELDKLPAEKRAARIAQLREQERRQRREWRRR